MKNHNLGNKKAQTALKSEAPLLFPFISLRREPFGALLFNPYLSIEKEFDETGALIAESCDGAHTKEELADACQACFGMDRESTVRKVEEVLTELRVACAIEFTGKGKPKRPPPSLYPAESNAALSAPKSVIWDVTYACNLSCPHCLTASGARTVNELNTQDACRLVDKLSEAQVLYLSLAGGEPLLRKDILHILAHIAETGIRVDIATNGYALPSTLLREFRELPIFHVQVSLDGIGREHDAFRGRRGSFSRACNTLKRLKDEGLSTSVSTTATARNIGHLEEIVDLAAELGCDAYKAIPFIPAGRGKSSAAALRLDRQSSLRMCKILTEASSRYRGRMSVQMESTYAFLLDPPAPSTDQNGRMICSAGYDTLSVGADGTAYPCPFLHDFPLGNILHDPMDRIWHQSSVLARMRLLDKTAMSGPCGTCEYAPAYCRGGCRASAYLDCGSLNGSDPLCFKGLTIPNR